MGGQCIIERDGYYWISGVCVTFGLIFLVGFIIPTARKLQCGCYYEIVMTARFSRFVFRASDFKMESKDVIIDLPRLSAFTLTYRHLTYLRASCRRFSNGACYIFVGKP